VGAPGLNGHGLASGVLVPVHAGWLISSFAPAINAPVSGSRVIDGSFCLFCGNASPWSRSTSALNDTDGPVAPAAGTAVSGTAAKLSNGTTATSGIRRRIRHPLRNPRKAGLITPTHRRKTKIGPGPKYDRAGQSAPRVTGKARRDQRATRAGMARARRSHARYLSGRQARSANRHRVKFHGCVWARGCGCGPAAPCWPGWSPAGPGRRAAPGADGGEPGVGDRAGAGPAGDGPTLPAVPVPAPEKAPPPPRGVTEPFGPPGRPTAIAISQASSAAAAPTPNCRIRRRRRPDRSVNTGGPPAADDFRADRGRCPSPRRAWTPRARVPVTAADPFGYPGHPAGRSWCSAAQEHRDAPGVGEHVDRREVASQ